MRTPVMPVQVERHEGEVVSAADDLVVTEEPLEIRLGHGPEHDRSELRLSVTMRTPGHDAELALGFLLTEGLIDHPAQVLRTAYCEKVRPEEQGNVVRVELHPSVDVDPARWQRNFYTTSSCGVCGKSSLEAVRVHCPRPLAAAAPLDPSVLISLPERMRREQTVFKHTGGIHAAALFDAQGELLLLREDVGRHNAVDKVVGAMSVHGIAPANLTLLVSGRAGFELVQKCVVAGIPRMAAVGAPSTLAVALARDHDLVLIGFLRADRFNVYAGT
jgi:FdhD protein